VHEWARDHRVHHKYTETDGDPYNARRGVFFSHYGWILMKKLPAVMTEGKKLDFSDFDADKVLMFQKR
jgi:stearoyl-CoA desaturase (delta-9 desaturase)